ncbi:MAG: hypothetical protein KDE55_02610 [Novosphingobium sp.]|nr:hypothetical protein [Novosphingobium sp.]
MTAVSAAAGDIKEVPESDPSTVARLFIAEGGKAASGGTTLAFSDVDATLLYDAVAEGLFFGPQQIGLVPMPLRFA